MIDGKTIVVPRCTSADCDHIATHEAFVDEAEPPGWYPYCAECAEAMDGPHEVRAVHEERVQYRFFWPHARDDMLGAAWQDQRPSDAEIREFRDDLPSVWLERRTVLVGPPERIDG